MANLLLNRLVILQKGTIVYDEKFHQGVNIIRGENGVGKSTIANAIYYILGGDFTKWLPEIEKCDYIIAEVDLNEKVLTFKREISRVSMQPMLIFYGDYESAIKDSNSWTLYPYRRSTKGDSFSQLMFKALGYPAIETADDEYITFNQALRLMYIDQTSPLDELMKDIDFDSPLIRKTTADLLLGVYDNALFNLQILLKDLKKNEAQFESELKLLKNVYKEVDLNHFENVLKEAEAQLERLEASLKDTEKITVKADDKKANRIKSLQVEVGELSRELKEKLSRISSLEYEIVDSQEFIEELSNQVSSLIESESIRSVLGELKVSYCPSCLQPTSHGISSDHCQLCKEPIHSSLAQAQIFRIRQQLETQIKESRILLEENNTMLEDLKNTAQSVRSKLNLKQKELNNLLTNQSSERNQVFEAMLINKGMLIQHIQQLQKDYLTAKKYWTIYNAYQRVKNDIERTSSNIEDKKARQKQNYQLAMVQINKYAKSLLLKDGPYEDAFKNAAVVSLDFSKNTYALDDRNNFSASSQVILKNSVRFGIFFASLKLNFIRYPKFILCDNIEDKGMNESRSRNFQKNLVELANAEEFKDTKFQIIFTTSMVAEAVNIPAYTIGSYYTPDNKALKFSSKTVEETGTASQ